MVIHLKVEYSLATFYFSAEELPGRGEIVLTNVEMPFRLSDQITVNLFRQIFEELHRWRPGLTVTVCPSDDLVKVDKDRDPDGSYTVQQLACIFTKAGMEYDHTFCKWPGRSSEEQESNKEEENE